MVTRMASLGVAVVAAVWWSVGIAIVQPATQPEESAGNNDYWARDVRFMLIALALCAFVWAVSGDGRRSALGLAGAFAWIGVDVALDRAGIAGPVAAVVVAVVAVGAVAAAWFLATRETRPRRGPLVLASAAAAAVTGLGAGVQSPTDTEVSLAVSGALVGLAGTVAALGCVWRLAPRARVSVVAFGAVALVAVAGIRVLSPGPGSFVLGVLLAGLLLTVLAVRAVGGGGGGAWAGAAVATFTALFFLGYLSVLLAFVIEFGEPLTALAGSPAVNGADEDMLTTAVALLTGLGVGGLVAGAATVVAEPWPHQPSTSGRLSTGKRVHVRRPCSGDYYRRT